MKTITTLLVANRGEIAVRVMRTARAMGIRTVAVYSEADAQALHVRTADVSVCIGAAPVAESYLRADKILEAARRTGADAIHPGYGFLSENQAFASACESAGIIFIGPPNKAIEVMGDKASAKRAMIAAGVPCVPGYQGEDQSAATLLSEARGIGLPVMVKAAAGGGGRGMRLVTDDAQLESAIQLAQSEAENAFGSRDLILEKAIIRPRHVEIQIFADEHGNLVHLGERDCSIQRRHQKVVEESPCPVMTADLRSAMGEAAVEAARAVGYVGAGTVEFLLDEAGHFYFLEMNTRLQVEHPVTESVTGFDLVEWQLRVARGEALPAGQDDVELFGHAIEVRLYAEDPIAGFLPSTGAVSLFNMPERDGIRVDAGVETGDEVSPFYDAMVAKIIAYGETREDARTRLLAALREAALLGLQNNRDFLIDVLGRQTFVAGEATTAFIEDHYGDRFSPPSIDPSMLAAAAVIQHVLALTDCHSNALSVSDELLDWSLADNVVSSRCYEVGETRVQVRLKAVSIGEYDVSVDGERIAVALDDLDDRVCHLMVNGLRCRYSYYADDGATLHLANGERSCIFIDQFSLPPESVEAAGGGNVTAPMHGQLLSIEVQTGDVVARGQRLAVLEAMKMQHEITANVAGTVAAVVANSGRQIGAGDLILTIEVNE